MQVQFQTRVSNSICIFKRHCLCCAFDFTKGWTIIFLGGGGIHFLDDKLLTMINNLLLLTSKRNNFKEMNIFHKNLIFYLFTYKYNLKIFNKISKLIFDDLHPIKCPSKYSNYILVASRRALLIVYNDQQTICGVTGSVNFERFILLSLIETKKKLFLKFHNIISLYHLLNNLRDVG